MSNEKVKLYKNSNRNKSVDYKPYVPQYQVLGVDPREYKSAVLPDNTQVAKPVEENPRERRPSVRQPYAAQMPSPLGRGKGPIPNVGNNIEHTWSSVDGDIIDDLDNQQIDSAHPMIDNNDYVSSVALGLPTEEEQLPTLDETEHPPRKRFTKAEVSKAFEKGFNSSQPLVKNEDDLFDVVNDLEEGVYLLIVSGTPICSGPMEEIQEQARALVFGEHEMCNGNPILDDDIVILKRVPIKIGLFLE